MHQTTGKYARNKTRLTDDPASAAPQLANLLCTDNTTYIVTSDSAANTEGYDVIFETAGQKTHAVTLPPRTVALDAHDGMVNITNLANSSMLRSIDLGFITDYKKSQIALPPSVEFLNLECGSARVTNWSKLTRLKFVVLINNTGLGHRVVFPPSVETLFLSGNKCSCGDINWDGLPNLKYVNINGNPNFGKNITVGGDVIISSDRTVVHRC